MILFLQISFNCLSSDICLSLSLFSVCSAAFRSSVSFSQVMRSATNRSPRRLYSLAPAITTKIGTRLWWVTRTHFSGLACFRSAGSKTGQQPQFHHDIAVSLCFPHPSCWTFLFDTRLQSSSSLSPTSPASEGGEPEVPPEGWLE